MIAATLALAGCRSGAPRPPATTSAPAGAANSADPEPWRAAVPAPGPAEELRFPAPETAVLPNGLSLLVCRRALPVVTVALAVQGGASSAEPGKSGVAALAARMMLEGTTRLNSAALAAATEDLGSVFDADAGRDYSYLSLTLLPEDLPAGLALIEEVARTPAFDDAELERVRSEWLSSLAEERQDPERVASLVGLRLLAGPTLGAPVRGGVPDVTRLTREDVRRFWSRTYQPHLAAVVVVGDVSLAAVEPLVRERFGSWRGAPATVGPPPSLPHVDEPRVVLVDRPGAVQSALFVAQPLPPRSAPGFETRQVMNAVLGGLFTSRLNQNLREEHAYTYGVHSSAIATRTWGGWVATTTVETSVTAAALHELVGELGDVVGEVPRRPFTDAEVERAKAALIQRQAAHLVDARDIAYDFVTTFVEGLPGDYPARYAERIGAVRRDDAARAARDFLTPDRLLVVVVGDRQRVERELRAAWPHVETAHPSLLE